MTVFVISDTHFGHANILKFVEGHDGAHVRPNFSSVEEMDEHMVEKWNSVVKPGDKVYHLGDVYFGSSSRADWLLSRLNGSKRLILGNHDNQAKHGWNDTTGWAFDPVLTKHFSRISMWRVFREFNAILSHVPLHETSLKEMARGECVNVHGHIHRKPPPTKRHFNVSVEWIDYTPVALEELSKKWM